VNHHRDVTAYNWDEDTSPKEIQERLANLKHDITAQNWDKDTSLEEIQERLANLKLRAAQSYPILDDDDLEAAIEEAADRLTHD
jgi:hypothetical protein